MTMTTAPVGTMPEENPTPHPPLVVIAEEIAPTPLDWLKSHCLVESCSSTDSPRFSSLLPRASGLIVRTYTRVDESLLANAPALKVVGRAGVGLDNIDVRACDRRSVLVVHTPDANTTAVVEFVFARIFERFRPNRPLSEPLRQAAWDHLRRVAIAPRQPGDLTLGIWGFGRIGSKVARAASGFGIRTIYHDITDIPADRRHGATPVSRDSLLADSDILSIHVDARPSNRHMLGVEALARVKPDVTILNTSRGFVVDAAALADFLHKNAPHGAAAYIDVHDPEPPLPEYPLMNCPGAFLSPHIAAATRTAHENMSWVVRDVVRVLRGEPPLYPAPPLA